MYFVFSLNPETLKIFPNYMWVYSFQVFYPAAMAWSIIIIHSKDEQFRRAITRALM